MIQTNTTQIASNIRQLRESKAYSQEYMAAKMGIGQNAYSKIELNKSKLTVIRLLQIAALLDTAVSELIARDEVNTFN